MATNFRVKIGEIGLLTFIRCFRVPKWSAWNITMLISEGSMAMIWLHCKKFELRSSNSGVYGAGGGQRRTLLVNQQFSYVPLAASLLDTAAISTEFCGVISTQFCFTYSQGGSLLCCTDYTLASATHF